MAEPSCVPDRPLGPGDPVLLVGGTGLIGRFLARVLVQQDLRPIVISRRPPPPGLLPVQALHLALPRRDLPELLSPQGPLSRELDAGCLGVVEILAPGPREIEPLLQATRRYPGRFVAIGSAAVFGRGSHGQQYAETDPPEPRTEVMRAKLDLERLLALEHARGRGTLTLRCAYAYGPGHGPLTPLGRDRRLFVKLRRAEPLLWVEPGLLAPLQPLWAGDLACAIVALLRHQARPAPLYHVAGPRTLDWQEYLGLLATGRGTLHKVRFCSIEELLQEQEGTCWLEDYLRDAPLLDDQLLRRKVHACDTELPGVVESWAEWCCGGGA